MVRDQGSETDPEGVWGEVLEWQQRGRTGGEVEEEEEQEWARAEIQGVVNAWLLTNNRNRMTKMIAVPTSNGKLDGHFGHCKQFAMVKVEENGIKEINYIDAPPHQPGLLPPWLAERGATDIIAGGMGQRAIDLFNQRGVNVFVGAPALTPEELVEGFLKETLNFSANYCDH